MVQIVNCPKCGKKLPDEAVYCLFCGTSIKKEKKRTGFPIAAGVLTIIASCICILVGILFIAAFAVETYGYYEVGYLVPGIFALIGFAFGLTAGILTLKRRTFPLAVIGIIFIMISAFLTFIPFSEYYPWTSGLLFGLPTLVLSILALIFTAISREEFT